MKNLRLAVCCALSLFLLFAPRSAEGTNGAFPTSNGARTAGRGGTDYGLADDATAIRSNPAGIAYIWGNRLDQSFFIVDPMQNVRNEFGRWHAEHSIIPGASFGAVFEVGRPWRAGEAFDFSADYYEGDNMVVAPWQDEYPNNLKLGLGILPVAGGKSDYDLMVDHFDTNEPLHREYFSNLTVAAVTGAAAYRINKYVSVGASFDFTYGKFEMDAPIVQDGRRVLQGPTKFDGVTFGDALEAGQAGLVETTNITGFSDIDNATSFGFGGRIGVYVNPTENLSLGLVYVTQTLMQDYLGDVTVDYTEQIAELDLNGDIDSAGSTLATLAPNNSGFDPALGYVGEFDVRIQDFHFPRQVAFGLGYRVYPEDSDFSMAFGFDVRWIQWSNVARKFKARLSSGTNVNLNVLTGAPSVHAEVPLNWQDQVVVAAGASFNVGPNFTWRIGYNWGENPVPGKGMVPVLPAIGEHHLASGLTFRKGFWEFHFSYEHTFSNTVRSGYNLADPGFTGGSQTIKIDTYWAGFSVRF